MPAWALPTQPPTPPATPTTITITPTRDPMVAPRRLEGGFGAAEGKQAERVRGGPLAGWRVSDCQHARGYGAALGGAAWRGTT